MKNYTLKRNTPFIKITENINLIIKWIKEGKSLNSLAKKLGVSRQILDYNLKNVIDISNAL